LERVEANLIAPVYIRYIKLLPAEAAQKAWQQLSVAVANLSERAKYAHTTALLVTFMDPDVHVNPDGTTWGDIALQAGEQAMSPDKSTSGAVELIKSLMMSRSKFFDWRDLPLPHAYSG
jgi:hypothetical protein